MTIVPGGAWRCETVSPMDVPPASLDCTVGRASPAGFVLHGMLCKQRLQLFSLLPFFAPTSARQLAGAPPLISEVVGVVVGGGDNRGFPTTILKRKGVIAVRF